MLHELGHAMGLGHPHDGSVTDATYDTWQYSVMSYNGSATHGFGVQPDSLMLLDILALQENLGLGAPSTSNTDDTYWWNPSEKVLHTIWDGGGNDTLSASGHSLDTILDLRQASFSSYGPKSSGRASNNLAIAFDTRIENAIGGNGNDTIIGNTDDNTITGGLGNDTLYGDGLLYAADAGAGYYATDPSGNESGNDTFVYALGDGDDTIYDGAGLDLLFFDNSVTFGDVAFSTSGDDLILDISDGGSIELVDFLTTGDLGVEDIFFDHDSTLYTEATIRSIIGVLPPASFSVANATAVEGNIITITVTRSGDLSNNDSIDFATSHDKWWNTASANDYSSNSGTLNFSSGEATKTFTVATNKDTLSEDTENFQITLSNSSAGTSITKGFASGFVEDAGPDFFSVANATGDEGDELTFTVTRTGDLSSISSLDFNTSHDKWWNTADGNDYSSASGTLTFLAGVSEQTFSVATNIDALAEDPENLQVNLYNASVNSSITKGFANGFINNILAQSNFSIANSTAFEGSVMTFTVTRSGFINKAASIDFATSHDKWWNTAGDADYTSASGTLNFAAGETEKTFTVTTLADALTEDQENFQVNLSNASAGDIIDKGFANGFINDGASPLIQAIGDGSDATLHVHNCACHQCHSQGSSSDWHNSDNNNEYFEFE